jgi:hypothetical protein
MGGETKAATFSIARCTPWRQAPIAACPPGVSAADVMRHLSTTVAIGWRKF